MRIESKIRLMNNDRSVPENSESNERDDVSVKVIVPNLSLEAAIERVKPSGEISVDDISAIGYPKFLFDYRCSLKRLFLSDREVPVSITVDGITGGRLRNDVYPGLETQTHPADTLLQPRLTRDDAVEHARSVIRKYLSFHYPTYILMSGMPETEILRENMAYGLYWLVPETMSNSGSRTVTIINSISGEVVEDNVETDQIRGSDIIRASET